MRIRIPNTDEKNHLINGSCREKDEVTKLETEVSGEYLSRHFKEGKFAAEGPASDALGKKHQRKHNNRK
jgi:hypothetical protein